MVVLRVFSFATETFDSWLSPFRGTPYGVSKRASLVFAGYGASGFGLAGTACESEIKPNDSQTACVVEGFYLQKKLWQKFAITFTHYKKFFLTQLRKFSVFLLLLLEEGEGWEFVFVEEPNVWFCPAHPEVTNRLDFFAIGGFYFDCIIF